MLAGAEVGAAKTQDAQRDNFASTERVAGLRVMGAEFTAQGVNRLLAHVTDILDRRSTGSAVSPRRLEDLLERGRKREAVRLGELLRVEAEDVA